MKNILIALYDKVTCPTLGQTKILLTNWSRGHRVSLYMPLRSLNISPPLVIILSSASRWHSKALYKPIRTWPSFCSTWRLILAHIFLNPTTWQRTCDDDRRRPCRGCCIPLFTAQHTGFVRVLRASSGQCGASSRESVFHCQNPCTWLPQGWSESKLSYSVLISYLSSTSHSLEDRQKAYYYLAPILALFQKRGAHFFHQLRTVQIYYS